MKRILATAVSVMLIAVLTITGTVAYFTDTDEAINVFEVGNVDIEQIEEQRKENTTVDYTQDGVLEEFKDNKNLMPSSYFTEDKEPEKHPTGGLWDVSSEGAIDKIVHVENVGENPAYVRTIFAFENNGGVDALIHKNVKEENGKWDDLNIDVTIDGQDYSLYCFTYNEAIPAGVRGDYSLLQFALDGRAVNKDREAIGDTYHILVFSQAVQSENMGGVTGSLVGADAAKAALEAAFGEITAENHPWIGRTDISATKDVIGSTAQFEDAILEGGNLVLSENFKLNSANDTATELKQPTVINLNGKTITSSRTHASDAAKSSTLTIYSDVTLADSGAVENTSDYGITVREGGKLTIKGGSYKGVTTVVNVVAGTVTIEDGHFETANSGDATYLLNCNDAAYGNGTARIIVKGGSFKGFDPANSMSEINGPVSFVADGYKSVKRGEYYVVVPESTKADEIPTIATSQAEFEDLVSSVEDGSMIELAAAGSYQMPATGGKDIRVSGTKDTVISLLKGDGASGSEVTLSGVTVAGNPSNDWYTTQMNGAAHVVYEDCIIENSITTYGDASFKNCIFNIGNKEMYAVFCYTGARIDFENCVFNVAGKAIKVYDEGNKPTRTVNVTGCTFNSSVANKAGVEIDSRYKSTEQYYVINIQDCKLGANVSKLWNADSGENANLIVNMNGQQAHNTVAST